ncbi:hypothetical protein CRUP_027460, partial [Coryphaenoides rupestris]
GVRLVSLSELYFDVSLLLWCCSLLLLTQRGLCSAYVSMLMVAFPLAAKTLLTAEFKHRGASAKYCVLYLLGLALPYVHFLFLIWVVFEIFTPILGRSGTEIPPEVVLATLVTLATIFLSSYFHTTRTFHDLSGAVESRDSGLWVNSFDYTAMQYVTPFIPELNDSARTVCRPDRPFCGYPWKNWYLPASEVTPSLPVEFSLVSREDTAWGTVKMSFSVKGPSHMSLYLLPHPGATLTSWSLGDGTPPFDVSGEYFVFYSHGLDAPAWSFWFEIQRTEQLDALLRRFPAWAFPSAWVSTYTMY